MRLWIDKRLHSLDEITTTDVVYEIEHNQWHTEFEADFVTEVLLIQESFRVLVLIYFILFVDKVAHLGLLLVLGNELCSALVSHLTSTLFGEVSFLILVWVKVLDNDLLLAILLVDSHHFIESFLISRAECGIHITLICRSLALFVIIECRCLNQRRNIDVLLVDLSALINSLASILQV